MTEKNSTSVKMPSKLFENTIKSNRCFTITDTLIDYMQANPYDIDAFWVMHDSDPESRMFLIIIKNGQYLDYALDFNEMTDQRFVKILTQIQNFVSQPVQYNRQTESVIVSQLFNVINWNSFDELLLDKWDTFIEAIATVLSELNNQHHSKETSDLALLSLFDKYFDRHYQQNTRQIVTFHDDTQAQAYIDEAYSYLYTAALKDNKPHDILTIKNSQECHDKLLQILNNNH